MEQCSIKTGNLELNKIGFKGVKILPWNSFDRTFQVWSYNFVAYLVIIGWRGCLHSYVALCNTERMHLKADHHHPCNLCETDKLLACSLLITAEHSCTGLHAGSFKNKWITAIHAFLHQTCTREVDNYVLLRAPGKLPFAYMPSTEMNWNLPEHGHNIEFVLKN